MAIVGRKKGNWRTSSRELRDKNGIFSIESLVGECRLHAVHFFGNLAADGTPFFCSNGFLSV